MPYTEKTISSETIYDGKIIRVRKDMVQLDNGKVVSRELVDHPGGVAVLAKTEAGRYLMVKQYRKPFDEELLEIPAGKLNYGENHYDCGLRELSEETGYEAGRYEYLGSFICTPGFCNEIIHLYYADQLKAGNAHLDEDEFLDVYEFSQEEIWDMIQNGKIKDAKTVIAFLMVKEKQRLGLL